MKKMLALCVGTDPAARRLSFAATCAVWKDIIPGYRIRLPTEREKEVKTSKEVKQLRAFESSFLAFYQKYLKLLEEATKSSALLGWFVILSLFIEPKKKKKRHGR